MGEEETWGTEDEGMEEGDDSQEEEGEGEKDADKSASESTTDGEKAGDTEEKKEAEEEEPSNLQLAWEMLELAKVVYTKQIETGGDNKSEMEEKLCSSILALGEV